MALTLILDPPWCQLHILFFAIPKVSSESIITILATI